MLPTESGISDTGARIEAVCGIFGLVSARENLDRAKFGLPGVEEILRHRGPDDSGHFLDDHAYLGQRRLSIIDLHTGRQPIFNEDGSKCVVFNGEIFNFEDIRKELEERGHTFSTHTDTETIIHAYEQWGRACVERFRGMFAFAVWDAPARTLFCARDRLGIKPFFYADVGGVFYFASEMKAILQYPHFPREVDSHAVASYFTLSYIPAPLTVFTHIRKLLPAHTLEVRNGAVDIRPYWDLEFTPDKSKTEGYFVERFVELLQEAVKLRMISDVPIGAFLSGGVDSATVVALMSRLSTDPVRSFTMGFGGNVGGYLDEREYARSVARRYHTEHREQEVVPDVAGLIDDIARSFDEPFGDASTIPSYYLCEMTSRHVKVALSGLGGDELFGGYERYLGFRLSTLYRKFPRLLRDQVVRKLVEALPERKDGHYTVNHMKRFVRAASLADGDRYLGFLTIGSEGEQRSLFREPGKYQEGFAACRDLMLAHFNSDRAEDPLDRVFYCDIKTYLPEDILACTDRMSMRHSLEVRVPFLDHKLMEFCATIPNWMKVTLFDKKRILKKGVREIVPRDVLTHRKQGFIGPMTAWIRSDLKDYVQHQLGERGLMRQGVFDPKTVTAIVEAHLSGREIRDKLIWSLLIFQSWHRQYVEGCSMCGSKQLTDRV